VEAKPQNTFLFNLALENNDEITLGCRLFLGNTMDLIGGLEAKYRDTIGNFTITKNINKK
jgi:hypothetical protein